MLSWTNSWSYSNSEMEKRSTILYVFRQFVWMEWKEKKSRITSFYQIYCNLVQSQHKEFFAWHVIWFGFQMIIPKTIKLFSNQSQTMDSDSNQTLIKKINKSMTNRTWLLFASFISSIGDYCKIQPEEKQRLILHWMIILEFIPKLAMLTLRAHYERLNSN